MPSIEFIKLSSNISKMGISDIKYKKFVESLNSNTLRAVNSTNAVQASSSSLSGTNEESYDYNLNIPVNYTTYKTYAFSPGQNVNIKTSSSFPHVVELFSMTNPGSYSWRAVSTTGGSCVVNLDVTIPGSGSVGIVGSYFLLLRSLNPGDNGVVNLNINNSANSKYIVTYRPQYAVTGGYPTPANFFTCKLKNNGDTQLLLADNSGYIRAYNDNGGTKTDGYSWGSASRITTDLANISYGLVLTGSYNPSFECDLYMGLVPLPSSSVILWFPNLAEDNSFVSGPATPGYTADTYICYDWSVGEPSWVHPSSPDIAVWDNFYDSYGYTHVEANTDNAAIALWMLPDPHFDMYGNFYEYLITHASVRKNSTNPKPHGFEWESKIGWGIRVMHTRDALAGDEYGSITRYYRPKTGTVNYSPAVTSKNQESFFSTSDLNQMAALKKQITATVVSGFEEKYQAWKNTWSRPELAIHSNPYLYARSTEYESLLKYSMKYGKAI